METKELKDILEKLFKNEEFLNEKDILEFGKEVAKLSHNNAIRLASEEIGKSHKYFDALPPHVIRDEILKLLKP